MQIMENLYNKGYLSYPRTETNWFAPSINLREIVERFTNTEPFSEHAQAICSGQQWGGPRNGNKDDKAHPPIHPVKAAKRQTLDNEQWSIFELITRHFLGSISKDAVGYETFMQISVGDELFSTSGLQVQELNYLEIYRYDKWADKVIPTVSLGQQFKMAPQFNFVIMNQGTTAAPSLLTEADLI